MSKLTATQVLDTNYLNTYYKGSVSKNEATKNISNVRFEVVNNKLQIMWNDCSDINWKTNVICKSKNQIPSSAFDGTALESISVKNAYANEPFIDTDIQVDTLYCYRIFTKFR